MKHKKIISRMTAVIVFLVVIGCMAGVLNCFAASNNDYSDIYTDRLMFMSDDMANQFIAFIYNVNPKRVSDEQRSINDIFNYLTGRLIPGSDEYRIAQAAFICTASTFVSKHTNDAQRINDIALNNLISLLKEKAGNGDNPGYDVANQELGKVKNSIKRILYYVGGFSDSEIMTSIDLAMSGYLTVTSIEGKVNDLLGSVQTVVNAFFAITSNNTVKAYGYYTTYVNFRPNGTEYIDLWMGTYEIMNSGVIDGFNKMMSACGFGKAWSDIEMKQMLRFFGEFTYHSICEQKKQTTIPTNPTYTVTFKADGKVISTETYTKNNPNINVPDVPSKKHYTGKWESFDLSSGGNKTVNAVYTPITYTVEFKTPFTGNSFLVEERTYTIENQSIDEPTIRKKDHYDGYWGDYDLSRGGNKVVYAYYTPTVYTVTFYGLHMQVISVQEYTIENPSILEPDLPEVEGYVRGRWSEYSLDFHDTDVYGYYSESLEYTSNGDGTCYVSGIGTCTPYSLSFGGMYGASTIIQIPERSPKGEMVVGIGDHALESLHWAFEKVIIPNTVEYIGKYAFADNQGIAEFEFSKQSKLKSIGEGAFTGICNLASFEIPDSVITIGELAFCGCWNLQNVIIGSQSCLDTIGCNAFSSCNLLTSITLPDSVNRIEDGAFYWSGLEDLFIPRNVTYIGTQICPSATIRVDSNNRVYHSSGNCVIETKKGILVTAGQNSVIPTDGSVKRIGKNAFAECSMESIVIPNSITQIDDGAFMFCWITDVYFWGTENEWNNIIVEDYTILNSTVHILGVQGKITGASLALGEKLTLKYYAAIFASNVNIIMRFTYEGETYDVIGVKDEKTGEYVFSFDRIPPSKMDAIVKAELILVNEDGRETVLAVKEEYSITQYCTDAKQDNPDNAALNHLLNDLETYNKAAEDYENGVSKDPSDVDWEPLTDTDFSLSEPADETVRFKAAGVRFGFVNRLFFKFTADDLNGLTVKVNDTLYTESDFTLVEGTENTYIIYSKGINATEFDKIFTAVLLVNGEEVQTLEYSVKSYVEAKQDDPEMGALVRSLYNYGKSSELYRDEM